MAENNDANTSLVYHSGAQEYGYRRPWDCGRGSSTVYRKTPQELAEDMNAESTRGLFNDPFKVENGVPDIKWNIDPSILRPLNDTEFREVLNALKGN
ncbi:hypothetical protein ISS07_00935 [Candidatus Woesearchaeota archaeon]|nr:hypothetical protein [Candidatus Woesearchaeota archaeon]